MFFDESDHKFKKNYFYKELYFLNFKPVLLSTFYQIIKLNDLSSNAKPAFYISKWR